MAKHNLLGDLLKFDFSALSEMDQLRSLDKKECAETAWAFFTLAGGGGRHVVGGFCRKVMQIFLDVQGRKAGEAFIFQQWGHLTDQARENICYDVLLDPSVLSTQLAVNLFRSPHSTLADQINIVSNLAQTIKRRWIGKNIVFGMLSEMLSKSTQDNYQRVSAFVEGVKADLEFQSKMPGAGQQAE